MMERQRWICGQWMDGGRTNEHMAEVMMEEREIGWVDRWKANGWIDR